jgi:hypothetical protein
MDEFFQARLTALSMAPEKICPSRQAIQPC